MATSKDFLKRMSVVTHSHPEVAGGAYAFLGFVFLIVLGGIPILDYLAPHIELIALLLFLPAIVPYWPITLLAKLMETSVITSIIDSVLIAFVFNVVFWCVVAHLFSRRMSVLLGKLGYRKVLVVVALVFVLLWNMTATIEGIMDDPHKEGRLVFIKGVSTVDYFVYTKPEDKWWSELECSKTPRWGSTGESASSFDVWLTDRSGCGLLAGGSIIVNTHKMPGCTISEKVDDDINICPGRFNTYTPPGRWVILLARVVRTYEGGPALAPPYEETWFDEPSVPL